MNIDELATYPGTTARIVAPSAEVRQLLLRAEQAGRLVTMTPPRPYGAGLHEVTVHLRPLRQAVAARPGRTLVRRVAWIGGLAAAVVAAAVWAIAWLLAHPAAVVAAVAGAALTASGVAKARRRRCPGVVVHCPKH